MFEGKRVSVIVPAYNEAHHVGHVVSTMPPFVDEIVVIDDGSVDDTVEEARRAQHRTSCRVSVVRHVRNVGVGASIRTGYHFAMAHGADVLAVMAGDGQMDPTDLEELIAPVARGLADYTKGNRLTEGSKPPSMPLIRYLGVGVLTRLTRLAAGYNELHDSQSGYTAVSAECLRSVPLERLHRGYGYPNHMLILLGAARKRVVDIPVRAVYGHGEESGLRYWEVAPRLLLLLAREYLWRRRHAARSTVEASRGAMASSPSARAALKSHQFLR